MLGRSHHNPLDRRRHTPSTKLVAAVALLALPAAACSAVNAAPPVEETSTTAPAVREVPAAYRIPAVPIALHLRDESGGPVVGAAVHIADGTWTSDESGVIELEIDQPTLVVIGADGMLPEPLVLTREMTPRIEVRMLGRLGPDGTERTVLHFGGDVMMGRRYLTPGREGTAQIVAGDGGASARQVVSSIAPLFGAADLSSVNLESVIGTLPADDAYPGKRFLLQSPPVITAALDELGVDVATLGNNHVNDWQHAGLLATIEALVEAGIAAPGADVETSTASPPALLTTGDTTIGFLSYTTVTGDFVNDSLPTWDQPVPPDLPDEEWWQYDARSFRFVAADGTEPIAAGAYRAGDAWGEFTAIEQDLDRAMRNDLWAALTAADAFPELQDWVARRGHGGAARFSTARVETDVAAARDAGADVVIVQIHGGFQFADVTSAFFSKAARTSVDAGADLVVGHHPHVLQGFEWYNGKLIAHSLGNFVFDQDFLATFSTVVLRTVFDDGELLQAKLYPTVLDGYRPEPVGGEAAARILRSVAERSTAAAVSLRLPDGSIGTSPVDPADGVAPAGIVIENGVATIHGPDAMGVADGLVAPSATPGLELGRDLFGWGSLEDVEADGTARGGVQWHVAGERAHLRTAEQAPSGNLYLELDTGLEPDDALVRPVARVTPRIHRLYDSGGEPLDAPASFSVRATVRVEGDGEPFVRLDGYEVVDAIPTRNPQSTLLLRLRLPLNVPADGAWHEVTVDLPQDVLTTPAGEVQAVMFYFGVTPASQQTVVGLDDIAFIEWRPADSFPPDARIAVDASRTIPAG